MSLYRLTLLLCFLTITSGCSYYANLSGTVVDGATGRPIEGALVVAQWTKPRGIPGMQYHELHKITETLTDKEGKFSISGTSGFLLDLPKMIIFKAGYIPWRNDMTFPGGKLNKDNEWNNAITYKMDVFTNKYTSMQLYDFLDYGTTIGRGINKAPIFTEVMQKLPIE